MSRMPGAAYTFVFGRSASPRDVAGTVRLSVLAAEALHGEARVALDAPHRYDAARRTCTVAGDTPAGRDLARLLANFARREFGADAVRIERRVAPPAKEPR